MEAWREELYLQHHGILGMKWGKRNGPPYPLGASDYSYSEKKYQKKNYKQIKKSYNKSKDPSRPYLINNKTKELINSKIKNSKILESEDIKNDLKELKKLASKWKELDSKSVDFYDSKAFKNADELAYKKTYEWFEKNEPEYLNEIIKNNDGKKTGLDAFHDFRKTFEGYEDELWDEAKKEWMKTEEGKLEKMADKAWDDHYNKAKEIGKKVSDVFLGKYGEQKLNIFGDETYSDLINDNMFSILNEIGYGKL